MKTETRYYDHSFKSFIHFIYESIEKNNPESRIIDFSYLYDHAKKILLFKIIKMQSSIKDVAVEWVEVAMEKAVNLWINAYTIEGFEVEDYTWFFDPNGFGFNNESEIVFKLVLKEKENK